MKISYQDDKCAVIDDLLPPELFSQIWKALGREDFMVGSILGRWSKEWGYEGSPGWSSQSFTRHADDVVGDSWWSVMAWFLCNTTRGFPKHVGNDWNSIRIHAHLFGRGVRIYWHADKHSLGSFAWYAHPEWRPHWGGELMLADNVPVHDDLDELPPFAIDRKWEDGLLECGMGMYFAPLPNRCILTAPGVFHAVNRVDPDAGDAVRCSVVGFLGKKKEDENADEMKKE